MSNLSDAMKAITQGVYILGVNDGQKSNLMTAAWLTQISGSPALLVAVGSTHCTADMIERCGHFTVSVLGAHQASVADYCGKRSGWNTNKLEGVKCTFTDRGDPLVAGAAAHFECALTKVIPAGDHVLFAADVKAAKRFSEDLLIYRAADYFSPAPKGE